MLKTITIQYCKMGYTSDSYSDTDSERSLSPSPRIIQKLEYNCVKYILIFMYIHILYKLVIYKLF